MRLPNASAAMPAEQPLNQPRTVAAITITITALNAWIIITATFSCLQQYKGHIHAATLRNSEGARAVDWIRMYKHAHIYIYIYMHIYIHTQICIYIYSPNKGGTTR